MIKVETAPSVTIKWFSYVMGLFLLAFLMYIISNGSISKYKTLLLG